MSTSLYTEALLEVEDLKRMAEENAKNKIIEAVTPRIRSLIESQLLNEEEADELVIGDLEIGSVDDTLDAEDVIDLSIPPAVEVVPPAAAPKIAIDVQGDLNIDLDEETADDLLLGQGLSDVVENYILNKRNFKGRVKALAENVAKLKVVLQDTDLRKASPAKVNIAALYYAKLVNEAVSLATGGIVMEESVDSRLLGQLKIIIKEIKHMARRRDAIAFRRLLEELEADQGLKEMMREEDEVVAAAEDVAIEDDDEVVVDEEPVEPDVLAAQDALGDLAAALGMSEPEALEDVELDVEEDEEFDVEEDEEVLELGEADEVDETYTIDENMLRRELRRLREEAVQASDATPDAEEHVGDPMDAQADWGGSDEVIDVSEEDLVNALEEELNRARRPRRVRHTSRRVQKESTKRARRPVRRATRSGASARVVKAERAAIKLRTQLNEMNVFNAKLLFANKLMQNRDLSVKQQRAIVEALDSAKTINEAKLLYKSMSASLSKSGGRLSEGRSRLLASSSRSARSAAPANSGAEVDRWALLAGLSGQKIK
jgi:hypothetical protein